MISKENIYNRDALAEMMPGTLVNLRMPHDIIKDARDAAKERGFSNIQGFFKEALRREVIQYREERAKRELLKMRGIAKGKKIRVLTHQEREAIALDIIRGKKL